MNKTAKVLLVIAIIALSLILVPSICNATDTTAGTFDDLVNAINNAQENDTITLTANIDVTSPITISGKSITINGAGFSISGTDELAQVEGANKSLITAMPGSNITLTNVTLENSPKYGVQAYDGGYVILDGVTISNCNFGGVLVNAGTVEIVDLTLEANGANNDNGIEISKGKSIADSANVPNLLMNGTISATNQENVIYLASDANDATTEIVVENTENTTNKLLLDGNKIVVTDSNNNVVYESNTREDITMEGDELPATYTVTLNIEGTEETVEFTVNEGTVLTSDDVEAAIDFDKLGLADRTISGYYTDKEYTTEFDFTKAINADTEIFVKLSEIAEEPSEEPTNEVENTVVPGDSEEIENPQTGDNLFVYVATALVAVVALGAIIKIRKNK